MASRPGSRSIVRLALGKWWISLIVLGLTAATAVACIKAAPTTLTTSLSGGGKEGEEITVSEGTGVKDTATLKGENAGKAVGAVKYAVYSDKECKTLVTKAGEVTVKEGKVPASEEKKLEAGAVYYWQAEYGGDSLDEPSKSTCGKEVLTVKAATTLKTSLSGGGKEGEEIIVAEGSKVKDQATLSGTKSSTAKGTIKYAIYKDKECKELVTAAGEGEVKEGKAPVSEEKELEAGAVYYWQAEYEGDGLHQASKSTCGKEVLTVKAATMLKTFLTGGGEEGEEIIVAEGSKVKDQATLSGTKSSTATGTIEYFVYEDFECKELVTKAGKGEVSEGKAPASEEKEPEAGTTYYWQAEYSGDGLHEASESTCGDEVVTVKANTTLTTSLSGGGKEGEAITVAGSAKVRDQATLGGASTGNATGLVEYLVYSDSECKELEAEVDTVVVEEGKVPASVGVVLPAGTYYWKAVYLGDYSHAGSTSPCGAEVETVEASSLSLTTSLSGEEQTGNEIEVQEEAAVYDTATLSGENASTATGTVKYAVYADEECEELVAEAGEGGVEEGEIPASEELKLKAGDTYYWLAVYSGDSEHEETTSICGDEVEKVAQSTSLTTLLAGGDESGKEIEPAEEIKVKEGVAVYDTATLGGENAATATGEVEYLVYSDEKCEKLEAEAGVVSIEEEGIIPSSDAVLLPAGTYYWQATYYGDSENKESTSPCGAEVEKVAPFSLTVSLSGGGESGEGIEVEEETPVEETATLHLENASTATGTVKYAVYADEDCEELVAEAGTVSVKEGKAPPSEKEVLPAGVYYWQAVYSGDLEHEKMTSICGEDEEIVAEETSLTTSLSGGGKSGEKIEVEELSAVSDTATLSGENASTATGAVTYVVYSDEKCEKLETEAGEVSVKEGKVPASEGVELLPGTYYWQAEYSGDSANKESISPCGAEVEKVTPAALTGSLSGGGESGERIEVQEETPVKDTATLNLENASTATGTVEYNVYSDSKCKELKVEAGTVEVEAGGKIPGSIEVELPIGTYYWQAVYSGDSEHAKATSLCEAVVQQVMARPARVVSVGDSYISGEGGRWAGNVGPNHLAAFLEKIDALGGAAYNDSGGGETIPRCHRSLSAEIYLGRSADGSLLHGKNIACSGAEAISEGFRTKAGTFFKPGLDFAQAQFGQALPQGAPCPLGICLGQAMLLLEFARQLQLGSPTERIKMVVISIGGNDFGFADVVKACAKAYMRGKTCSTEPKVKSRFEEPAVGVTRARIREGILRIGEAMDMAGYARNEYALVVQNYPSPIPSMGNDFRYLQTPARAFRGRCPFKNVDALWANGTVLPTIDNTVRQAAVEVFNRGYNNVRIMELRNVFNGRRLCERSVRLETGHWRVPNADKLNIREWINQVRLLKLHAPFMIQEDFHPNFFGQLALRNCLRKLYDNGVPNAGCVIGPGGGWERVRGVEVPSIAVQNGTVHSRPLEGEPKMQLVAP